MEEALYDVSLYREFAKLDGATARLPDETTILRFRRLLERHNLAVDMLRVVKHAAGQELADAHRHGAGRDVDLGDHLDQERRRRARPEMKQTKKGNNWYFV